MKRLPAILLCLAVGILIAGAGLWQAHKEQQPITILTELPEGEFVREVELNRGKLLFLTPEEIEAQRTEAEREEARKAALDFRVFGQRIATVYSFSRDEAHRAEFAELMNQHPEQWRLSARFREESCGRATFTLHGRVPVRLGRAQ